MPWHICIYTNKKQIKSPDYLCKEKFENLAPSKILQYINKEL